MLSHTQHKLPCAVLVRSRSFTWHDAFTWLQLTRECLHSILPNVPRLFSASHVQSGDETTGTQPSTCRGNQLVPRSTSGKPRDEAKVLGTRLSSFPVQ